jgi:hypothetical protein
VIAGAWQSREAPRVRTGELLGAHTIAELADMMEVTLYESGQMNDAIGACIAWLESDPRGFGDFSARVHTNSLELAKLLSAAKAAVDATPEATRSITPVTGTEYSDLVAWRGRFTALDREFRANPHGCAPPDYEAMPQPKAPDPDLSILHGSQAITQPVDQGLAGAKALAHGAASLAQSRMPYVLAGAFGTLALFTLLRRK